MDACDRALSTVGKLTYPHERAERDSPSPFPFSTLRAFGGALVEGFIVARFRRPSRRR